MALSGHVPAVAAARVHELMASAPPSLKTRFYQLWHDLFYREPPERPPERTFSELEDADVQQMLANRIIERAPADATTNTNVFRIPEPEKNRARIITWTIWVNTIEYHAAPELNISAPARALLDAEGMHSAVVADLRAAFYQIEIPQEARHRFTFEHAGEKFRFARVPMGARQSAELCAIYSQAICLSALQSIALDELMSRSIFHIDNVRIPANPYNGAVIKLALEREAERWGAAWGECEWARRYDFLGFSYDHVARTLTVKASKRKKLLALANAVSLAWPSTGRQWQAATAKVITYARALALAPTAFAQLATVQKLVSHPRVRDRAVNVHVTYRTQLCCAARLIANLHPIAFEIARPVAEPLKLFTDASLDGYAAVLSTSSTFRVIRGTKHFETINRGELYAVDRALKDFHFELRFKKLELHMDSQVGLACIRNKAGSTSRELGDMVRRILKRINRLQLAELALRKVHTKENPADAPSRQRKVNPDLPPLRGIVEATGPRSNNNLTTT